MSDVKLSTTLAINYKNSNQEYNLLDENCRGPSGLCLACLFYSLVPYFKKL